MGNNSVFVEDIAEILAHSRAFTESGYWMMSDKFHHD